MGTMCIAVDCERKAAVLAHTQIKIYTGYVSFV